MLSQAVLEPGDEIVCGWPSFPSYVIYAAKQGATVDAACRSATTATTSTALAAAVGPRTKIVYVCHPNNPTGTMNTREELDAFLERVPDDVLVVVDQAYFEYIDRAGLPRRGRGVLPRRAAGARPAHVLEDLRPRRRSASATPSGRATSARRWRRCAGRST